jgi:Flp pilus assembly pilin Flp
MMRKYARDLLKDERGIAAVEMAILGPVFLALLFGVIQCGILVFAQASLHYAVQKGVRCAAVMNDCPSPASYYFGSGLPEFTPTLEPCGQALTATVAQTLSVVIYRKEILLSATSCFPDIKSTKL